MTNQSNTRAAEPWKRVQCVDSFGLSLSEGWESFQITETRGGEVQRRVAFKTPTKPLPNVNGPFIDITIDEYVGISRRSKVCTARIDEEALRRLYRVLHEKFGPALAPPSQPTPEPVAQVEPVLPRDAVVGNATFRKGVPIRLVVEAAFRQAEYKAEQRPLTKAELQEQERNRRAIWDMINGAPPEPSPVAQQGRDDRWKVGNEFAPFHKSASHVNPDYRDGWNACYEAARASLPAGMTPERVAELVAARDKILAASLPAGGVVDARKGFVNMGAQALAEELAQAFEKDKDAGNVTDPAAGLFGQHTADWLRHVSATYLAQPLPANKCRGVMRAGCGYLSQCGTTCTKCGHEHLPTFPTPQPSEPIAWESTTPAYAKFITQARYDKSRPGAQRWYKPYRCSACAQPSETQGRRQMTEEELVACLVKSSCIGKVKMSYESGPYSITRPSLDATRLKDAIEAHHGIPASPQDEGGQA